MPWLLNGIGAPDERENSVRALQRRGVVFWKCNDALERVATQIAKGGQSSASRGLR